MGAWGWEPVFFLNTISTNIDMIIKICVYMIHFCQELLKRSDFQQKTGITFKVRMSLEEYTYRPARPCCMMRHKKKIQAMLKQQKHRRMRRGGCLPFCGWFHPHPMKSVGTSSLLAGFLKSSPPFLVTFDFLAPSG